MQTSLQELGRISAKFYRGEELYISELEHLELIDKCVYVVNRYFRTGTTPKEMAEKLNSLFPALNVSTIQVYDVLIRYYGDLSRVKGKDQPHV